jgi:hypothetical protein
VQQQQGAKKERSRGIRETGNSEGGQATKRIAIVTECEVYIV